MRLPPPEARKSLKGLVRWAWNSWATRSLAVSAAATVFDVSTLVLCVEVFHWPNPLSAVAGVLVGSTFTFIANRYFAFREKGTSKLGPQIAKFAAATGIAVVIHATLVYLLADRAHVPVVIAKFMADIVVFTVGQTLALRFIVFQKDGRHRPRRAATAR